MMKGVYERPYLALPHPVTRDRFGRHLVLPYPTVSTFSTTFVLILPPNFHYLHVTGRALDPDALWSPCAAATRAKWSPDDTSPNRRGDLRSGMCLAVDLKWATSL